MLENEFHLDKNAAIVIDLETKNFLGRITLVGDPVPATEWISTNGPLQGFAIVDGRKPLRQVWANQEEVLVRTNFGQRSIKIITYPTEGENQGYLDFISDYEAYLKPLPKKKTRMLTQRGFAFLQSLFSI